MAFEKLREKAERGAARQNTWGNDSNPFDGSRFQSAGLDVPSGIKTVGDFENWLARQPLEVQNQYFQAAGSDGPAINAGIKQKRVEAFRRGETLPGLDETGAGTEGMLSKEDRATGLAAQNIRAGGEIEGMVSQNLGDYTAPYIQDPGVDWRPQDRYHYLGETPDLEVALQEQAINQERTDTTGVDAQKRVLGEYANLYNQGGLNAIDRARIEQARRMRAGQARGQEAAIMQQAEQMGRAGSNTALLGRMQAQQGATNARSMDDLQTMALGLQRRDALLRDQGTLGGQVQTAQDAIDQFNTLGERDRVKANIDRTNKGNELEWGEGNRRESVNAAEYNRGVDSSFGYEGKLSGENTDRRTQTAQFNVGPNQGARGMMRDMAGAKGITMGARDAAGQILGHQYDAEEAAKQAEQDRWVQAGTSALTFGLDKAL